MGKKDKKEKEESKALLAPSDRVVMVKVESLGAGLFNILGEMVGAVVNLSGFAVDSTKKSVQKVKKKVKQLKK